MEDIGVSLWAIVVMGGPVILAAVLGFGIWRQRARRRELAAARRESGASSEVGRDQRR
jgi:uncharacterized iron-regulated membrane protein